jgi:hypothetical protein
MSVRIHGAAIRFSVRPNASAAGKVYRSIVKNFGSEDLRGGGEPRGAKDEAATLEAAFATLDWRVVRNAKGDVVDLVPSRYFFSAVEAVLEALGPLVVRGSFVVLETDTQGTDGWVFDGEECVRASTLDEEELAEILGKKGLAIYAKGPRPLEGRGGEPEPRKAPSVAIRCSHPKFGPGTIVAFEGDKADVQFDAGERRKLLRTFLQEG